MQRKRTHAQLSGGESKARNVVSSKCEHPHKNVETDSRTRSPNDIQSGKPSPCSCFPIFAFFAHSHALTNPTEQQPCALGKVERAQLG
jgi:hypothetical protein